LAIGVEPSWQSLCQGKSGIGALTRFDATGFRTRIAGEVNSFNPSDFMDSKLVKRADRFIHFALAASRMAVEYSMLTINPGNSRQV